MNKWFKIIGFVIFVSFIGNTSANAASSTSLFVNGQAEYDFITVEGRTMVKLRSLSDPSWPALAYDPKTGVVMIQNKDKSKKVQLVAGRKTATVNGKAIKLDAAVVNKNGSTYVPIRFISETLGGYVYYNNKDKRVIVRTPAGQEEYETLMHGDLTKARHIALGLEKLTEEAPPLHAGEGYNYFYYTFPEGEALRFTLNLAGYSDAYYEVNNEGLAVIKWQKDDVAKREWGAKPTFKSYVYFLDEYMHGLFTYGIVDAQGKDTELGKFSQENCNNNDCNKLVLKIEGEKRTDQR
ncbi:copper amine oxidase N-terminal domain-containing protein [Lysinibacillus xylanilyticus]|uniref:copper amine oxidase N-terminal domain-containing protein n=1 Tax=Lysinibacillus xylanilyticus TaxID=582475 RepID=UPI00382E131A